MINREAGIAIHQLMNKFESQDMSLLEHVADNIDLAIEHYQDETDVAWQQCTDKEGFVRVLGRLAEEVFPKGTNIVALNSESLGEGWVITRLTQRFWYALMEQEVTGKSIIISHEHNNTVDYFREVVQSVEPMA